MEKSTIIECFSHENIAHKESSTKKPLIKVLDLFSGIGGFSLALKGITQTVGFCEIDWACQQVLQRHHGAILVEDQKNQKHHGEDVLKSNPKFLTFERKKKEEKKNNEIAKKSTDNSHLINPSPPFPPLLFKDIHDIDKSMLTKYSALKDVEMLTAGFPCTDISVANFKGDGIDGNASGLFFEILRLVDLLPSVKFVFLENSPNIRLKGLDSIVQHFKKRGFSCFWTYVCASDVGAYHRRKRWFCLCTREKKMNKSKRLQPAPNSNILQYNWREDKSKPRILHKDNLTTNQKKEHVHRCRMLGNSIVPQAAAYAWNTLLCHIFSHHFSDRFKYLSNQLNSGYVPSYIPSYVSLYVPSPPSLIDNFISIQCSDGKKSFSKTRWVTPNYSFWHMFSGIRSQRCNTTLTVQVFYDKNTKIKEQDKTKSEVFNLYICNANFIEHLMGYPNNWTKFTF